VLPRTIPACRPLQPFSYQQFAASCLSSCTSLPLFSIAYRLFCQNTRGGCTLQNRPFRISHIQTLFRELFMIQLTPTPSGTHWAPRVSLAIVFARPLFSLRYESLFLQLPCFHIHTKHRGCGGRPFWSPCARRLRLTPKPFHPGTCPPLRCQSICPQTPAVTCPLGARKARCSQPRGSTNSTAPFPPSKT